MESSLDKAYALVLDYETDMVSLSDMALQLALGKLYGLVSVYVMDKASQLGKES